jgi:Holliday junction resolvasome RuvABC endonuclease subunit
MKILSLDVSSHCGWAISNKIYGVWELTPKRDESGGMRLLRFKAKLQEVVNLEKIQLVVFERSSGIHKGAIIVQSELHGVLKIFCEENGIEHKAYSAKEIKKFATGKGNANKEKMILAAKEKLGYNGDNDNEADALWILELAKRDFNLI